ncbi:putative N-acetyltransferase [Gregarina niphandrodes]|uniref:N-acetyltransferase n=1 Tax=Gregarina niphandrodes TaxID=110365 RepID=A0A023AXJ1_GRENI|nr:putative N-acetyltransferase [Gregarina niphandrodes]EZG43193.1 putative N-acetyltransferase [Gregarina niphandrodes]|eukprot:XP_011133549.1 putative N-acetyltransferase [Gregarina niphandrodes]
MRMDDVSAEGLQLKSFGTADLGKELAAYKIWMDDPGLKYELGTDEGMTEDEIKDMQRKWLEDEDKFDYTIWADGQPVGDIGLFYKRDENGHVDHTEGEISMMIAEKAYRRKGLGKLAYQLAIQEAFKKFNTKRVVAKIKQDNEASIRFFQRLGYTEESRSQVFNEVTMVLQR